MLRRYTILREKPTAAPERGGGVIPAGRPGTGTADDRGAAREFDLRGEELGSKEVADVARDPTVRSIAPTMPIRLIEPLAAREATPKGAKMTAWGVAAVGATTSEFDGVGVTVAVLDTGVDSAHPAFAGVELEERDFTGTGNGDENGHGTHCAGTIFGRDVQEIRIGIARGVTRALIGKVLDASGSGDSDSLYQGMQWAMDNGAKVISMSIGLDFPGLVTYLVEVEGLRIDVATSLALDAYRRNLRMFDAVMRFVDIRSDTAAGPIVVAAAGNESGRDETPPYEIGVSIPAAANGMISVGALGQGDDGFVIADFSNTLPVIAAPGVAITSARPGGGLATLSGTSMATPHVAGVAALWWQATAVGRQRLTARTVESRMRAGATTEGLSAVAPADFGDGLVQAP
jgi:subtilisin family serine protease